MTRKDFELIAKALRAAYAASSERPNDSVIDVAARHVADALATTNPRFDSAKFLTACGVQS